jgi:hypothetical protein
MFGHCRFGPEGDACTMARNNKSWMALSRRVPSLLTVLAVILCLVIAVLGGPLVPLWAVAMWAVCLACKVVVPPLLAIAYGVVSFCAIELALLHLSPVLGRSVQPVEYVVWTGVALAACGYRLGRPSSFDLLSPAHRRLALSVSAGPVTVIVVVLLAQVIPNAIHLTWAMNADSVNVMGFARRMLADGGIDPGSTPQSTPLPFAMVASNMAGGRASLANDAVLRHDVTRLAEVWVFAIALCCLLTGGLVARVARNFRLRIAVPVTIAASVAGLSWYFIGVQFDGGFINSAFALVLLLAAWLVFIGGERHPVSALVMLLLASTVLLAVWSPLVVCLIALEIVLFIRGFRTIREHGVRGFAAVGVAAAIFLGYAVAFVLPALVGGSGALAGDGGFPPIGPKFILAIVAVVVVLGVVVARVTGTAHATVGALALILAFSLGLAFLLFQRRAASFLWGYYPAKYAWTVSLLLLVIAMTFALTLLARAPGHIGSSVTALVGVVGLFVSLIWSPSGDYQRVALSPLVGILQGGGGYNRIADTVFRYSGSANGYDVLWKSAEGDYWPNYWLLQTDIPNPPSNPVRAYASIPGTLSVDQICEVLTLLGPNTIVHTAELSALAELTVSCPSEDYRVIVEH